MRAIRGGAVGLATAALVAVALALPGAAAGASSLVLFAPSLTGFHAAKDHPAAARADLAAGLPAAIRKLIAGATPQSSAQAGAGQLVRSDALQFDSAGAATRALATWRHRHRGRAVPVGSQGSIAVTRVHGAAVVEVAWRERVRVGELVLSARRSVHDPDVLAVRYAKLADAALNAPIPRSAWGRALDEINANGSISKQTALQLFVLAYGSLPGVKKPPGEPTKIPSATLAGEAVLPYRSQLTKAQLAVVDSKLGLPAPGPSAHVATLGDPGFTPDATLQSIANNWITAFQGKLGYTLPLTVVAGKTTTSVPGANADAYPLNSSGDYGSGTKAYCRVRVTSSGLATSAQFQALILAHEVFHCFQFAIRGLTTWDFSPDWVGEGTADWAALSVDPVPYGVGGGNISEYIQTSGTPLFTRSYDAVGFWGHAQDITGNLWPRMFAILTATSNEAAFSAAAGGSDPFLSTWGSSVVRTLDGLGGFAWHMFSPIVPPDLGGLVLHPDGVISGTGDFDAAPYTTSHWVVNAVSGQPLEHYEVQGHARLSPQYNYTELSSAWFCTSTKPCECPKGTEGEVPSNLPLSTHTNIALSGDPDAGTHGFVESAPLSEFCKPPKPPKPGAGPLGCANGCGSVQGDPHMETIDGAPYDFQSAGEFTVVRSTTDDLQIQERQQPARIVFKARGFLPVSVVTAIALRDARATLEFDHTMGSMAVRLNKRLISVRPRHVRVLAGGGELALTRGFYAVVWPDGTQARVFPAGDDGVSMILQPAASRTGKLRGLLGNFDRNPADDFASRSGRAFTPRFAHDPATLAAPLPFKTLYGSYGNSWRITQRESLLFYPHGKSTRSYTIRGFPRHAVNVNSVPVKFRMKASATCRRHHVRNVIEANDCVFDVGATGSSSYAGGAATVEQVAPTVGSTLPRTGSRGVSPWTQLSAGADTEASPVPSLATAGSGFVAAFALASSGTVQVASFEAPGSGVSGVSREVPASGWSSVGNPVLFPAAGGGLQMLFDGIRSTNPSDPLDGTILTARNADGTFGTPALASTLFTGLGSEAVLAADGSTPLFATAQSGELVVNAGSSGATQIDLSGYSPGSASDPALAYDSSGRLWLAWYADGNTPLQAGLYLLQLDPATGSAAGAATAIHVPQSSSEDLGERIALACTTVCRVVYVDRGGSRLLTWAPGDAAPTVAVSGSNHLSDPAAAYAADGRLWVVWVDGDTIDARLGDTRGQGGGGAISDLGTPKGQEQPGNPVALSAGNALLVSSAWTSDGRSTVWAATVAAP
jgi:hypothetical protein